jgi:multicomponent Na+:H+ antiporter subunit C
MSSVTVYFTAAALIVAIGLSGVIVSADLVRKLIGINVMGAGVFLMLVTAAARPPDAPDPVPHAMVLTGIVVTVAATGFGVTLIRRLQVDTGQGELPEDQADAREREEA